MCNKGQPELVGCMYIEWDRER